MDLFIALEDAIVAELEKGDLPEYLAEPLYAVARNPQKYAGKRELVERLLQQINDFNLYADTGCFKEGCDAGDLEATLRQLG